MSHEAALPEGASPVGQFVACARLVAEPGCLLFQMETSPTPNSQDEAAKRARREAFEKRADETQRLMIEALGRNMQKYPHPAKPGRAGVAEPSKALGPSKLGARILEATRALGAAQTGQTATEPERKD